MYGRHSILHASNFDRSRASKGISESVGEMLIRQYFKPRDGLSDSMYNVKKICVNFFRSMALATKKLLQNFFHTKYL